MTKSKVGEGYLQNKENEDVHERKEANYDMQYNKRMEDRWYSREKWTNNEFTEKSSWEFSSRWRWKFVTRMNRF